jgi:DNA polymerase-3 subunit epsilon
MAQIVFLDTETTGLSGDTDKIIELAIVDYNGEVLFDKLINPARPINNSHIHGITDNMISGQPTFEESWNEIITILKDKHIIIYKKDFDTQFFPDRLRCAKKVSCAMQRFRSFHQGRQYNLKFAAQHIGYIWEGPAHRALADTLATRAVWLWLDQNENANIPEEIPLTETIKTETTYKLNTLDEERKPPKNKKIIFSIMRWKLSKLKFSYVFLGIIALFGFLIFFSSAIIWFSLLFTQ